MTVLSRNGFGDWGGRVLSVKIQGTANSVTLSGGALNAIPQSGEQASDLLRRADAALYAAKRAGRNRVLAAD